MRETATAVREAFKHSPIASAFLAVVIVGFVFLGAQSYMSRHGNWQRDFDDCVVTTRLRWEAVKTNRIDADREASLADTSTGNVQAQHMKSSVQHDRQAYEIEKATAPTQERRIAYCRRIYPEPGILFD